MTNVAWYPAIKSLSEVNETTSLPWLSQFSVWSGPKATESCGKQSRYTKITVVSSNESATSSPAQSLHPCTKPSESDLGSWGRVLRTRIVYTQGGKDPWAASRWGKGVLTQNSELPLQQQHCLRKPKSSWYEKKVRGRTVSK